MKALKHLKTILRHKYEVFKLCVRAGIIWQGIIHDMSKFSPTEFFESVKYYKGTESPILSCKKDKGYSDAWFHHRGRNKHHEEYWVDKLSEGGVPVVIPYKYAVEMVCDIIAASKTYNGKDYNRNKPYEYFASGKHSLHTETHHFVESALKQYAKYGDKALNPKNMILLYKITCHTEPSQHAK